jgi:hypothetical protein
MKNRPPRKKDEELQQNSAAQIIASIPLPVYYAFFVLFVALVAISIAGRYLPHTGLSTFADGFTSWLVRILLVSGIVIVVRLLYVGYCTYHDVVMKHKERKTATLKIENMELKNNLLRAKVNAAEMLPAVMQYAIQQGSNVRFEGLEVSSPFSNVHTLGGGQTPQGFISAPSQDYLPEPYKLSDVLSHWQPTKDGILLAKKQDLITVPMGESLCHTTFTGNTDAGKTNNERALLIQLLFLEQIVYLCDRNYQRYRMDKKLGTYYDYGPIAALLAHEPIDKAPQALALLKHLYSELEDRRARRRHNLVQFPDIYMVWDELPAFCGDEPEIMQYVGRFLRESRQYGIFFIGAAQDLLNQTLNNDNGAVRDNLLTNYYGGGDSKTARMVLNIPTGEKIDENGLGQKGVTYLRAKGAGIERVKARAALSDELATQLLLGDRVPVRQQVLPVYDTPPAPPEQHARADTNIIPLRQNSPRKATLTDAIEVWNEFGEMGRPRLQKLLQDKGLECSDYLANTLLSNIKARQAEG